MNEQTTKLIEQLAAKLGTTAEYLWSVLVKQAYVDGVQSLVVVLAWVIGHIACIVFFVRCTQRIKNNPNKSRYSSDNEEYVYGQIFAGVCSLFCLIWVVSFSLDAITAFNNPEYWALDYILKKL